MLTPLLNSSERYWGDWPNLSTGAGGGDADNGGYPGEGVDVSLRARGVLARDDTEMGEESLAYTACDNVRLL